MAVIRSDLVGVIHAPLGLSTVILRAGDTVPEGARVHESRLGRVAETATIPDAPEGVKAPAGNASAAAWREFLESQSVDFPAGATRKQMVSLWESRH